MYVYRVGYISQIDSIFRHGYSRQFLGDNEGTDYGDGIYCNIDSIIIFILHTQKVIPSLTYN